MLTDFEIEEMERIHKEAIAGKEAEVAKLRDEVVFQRRCKEECLRNTAKLRDALAALLDEYVETVENCGEFRGVAADEPAVVAARKALRDSVLP